MKKVAILQSNYIPWKGYFDLISAVDEFILYDDMQYTKRDWRNRNQIKTPQGIQWLSIPVITKGKFDQKINETEINGANWASLHWKSFTQNYKRAKHFYEIAEWLEPLYLSHAYTNISHLNYCFIKAICEYLGIKTLITSSTNYHLINGKTERLVDLCIQANATEYLSGPSAIDYIDEGVFSKKGIKLSWFEYKGYQEYPQLWGDFAHNVSIVDLLFNCGKDSPKYMRYVNK